MNEIKQTHKRINKPKVGSLNILMKLTKNYSKSMLSSFSNNADEWSIEEKRTAIKTFVRKILWDGDTVHMYLFNADGECEFPLPNKEKRNADFAENPVPLGEDSERDTYALPFAKKACFRGIS